MPSMTPFKSVRTARMWRLRGGGATAGAAALAALLLASCVQSPDPAVEVRFVAGADEPQAAEVGRGILEAGGNAADAAVAMGLTMAVTMPSRVGLGGGGACLVHDGETGAVEEIEFLPDPLSGASAGTPNLAIGLFALQAAHGSMRWSQLVAEAEGRARFGFQLPRGLVEDARAAGVEPPVQLTGGTLAAGAEATATDLADTFALLRERGGRALNQGPLAERYAQALGAASAEAAGLDAAQAETREAVQLEHGRDVVYFPASAESNGPALAQAWGQGGAGQAGNPLPTAHVVAMSSDDTGVVCSFTLNGLFGTGQVAGDTGILPARPAPAGQPMIGGLAMWANLPRMELLYAGTASAGPGGVMAPLRAFSQGSGPVRGALASAEGTNALAIGCEWDRALDKYCDAGTDPRGRGSVSVFEFGPGILERIGGDRLRDFTL